MSSPSTIIISFIIIIIIMSLRKQINEQGIRLFDMLIDQPQNMNIPPSNQQRVPNSQQLPQSKFSQFAHNKQAENKQKQKMIQDTVQSALLSHIQAIKKYTSIQKNILNQHNKIKGEINKLFIELKLNKPHQIEQFMKKPIHSFIQSNYINENNLQMSIKTFLLIQQYLRQYTIVEGKIVENKNILMNQYKQFQDTYLIPTKFHNELYLKLDEKTKQFEYVYLKNNKIFSRSEIMHLNKNQRQTMVNMILIYLKTNQIQVEKEGIQKLIDKQIHKY